MAERVTVQTIADALGVPRTTVSNAYNRPDQLAPELRKKVLEPRSSSAETAHDFREAARARVITAEPLARAPGAERRSAAERAYNARDTSEVTEMQTKRTRHRAAHDAPEEG